MDFHALLIKDNIGQVRIARSPEHPEKNPCKQEKRRSEHRTDEHHKRTHRTASCTLPVTPHMADQKIYAHNSKMDS
jgi:hypothetical protein